MSRYRGDDDEYGRGRGPAREFDEYNRERYGERGDYGFNDRRPAREFDDFGYRSRPRFDERDDYAPPRGGGNYRADEERGRGDDEGRDYLRQRYGRGRRRGASRSHLRCRDIMTRDVTVATRDATLEEVAAMMRDEDTGIIPVVDRAEADAKAPDAENARARRERGGGKLVGLITDRDLVVRAVAEGKDARAARAEEVMTTDIHSAQPNDRVIDAIRKMGDKQVRRIPIVDREGNLRGIISMADVALETEEDRELADALEEISSGSSFWSKVFG